jgi:putative lipoprotein
VKNLSLGLAILVFLAACGDQKVEQPQLDAGEVDVATESQELEVAKADVVEADDSLQDNSVTISGDITYDGEIALPENAMLVVRLVDLSNPENGVTTLLTESYLLDGPLPFSYQLNYDSSLLAENGSYGLRAVVRLGEEFLLTGGANLDSSPDTDVTLSLNLYDVKEE